MDERRKYQRIPVRMPVGIHVKDLPSAIDAEVKNISLGGAFIETKQLLPVGSEIKLELRFKSTTLISGKVVEESELDSKYPTNTAQASVVRWVQEGDLVGFGVEFAELDSEKKAFIEKLVQYYEQLLKAGVDFS